MMPTLSALHGLRLGFALMSSLAVSSHAFAEDPVDWKGLTQTDLKAAHNIMLESHPGPVDEENPEFADNAERAFENVMSLAEGVNSEAGYIFALRAYASAFRDGHFWIIANPTEETKALWPGIIPDWRNDTFVISRTAAEESELQGAELRSCDGKSAAELMRSHVFRFSTGKPDQIAYWARNAPVLLVDQGNPFVSRLKKCAFRRGGKTFTARLHWREMDDQANALLSKSTFGDRPAPGVREFSPGMYWINLPNFSPRGEEEVSAVSGAISRVAEMSDALKNAKVVVVDVRGNQGGNSSWGVEFIDALWGEQYRESRQPPSATAVDWRASQGNLEHMDYLEQVLKSQGREQVYVEYVLPVKEGMKEALAKGEPFYRQEGSDDDEGEVESPVSNPVQGKVYFLTHGYCASACLDFADLMLSLENVTHIGYPTSSDTNYLELRVVDLPSGRARMGVPIKVYRGRKRANSEFYNPEIRYDSLDWSDQAIEAWVTGVIDSTMD